MKSLQLRLQKDDSLQKRYQKISGTDVKAGYVRKVKQVELNENRVEHQWNLPHHHVIKPHKFKKMRRVCNAAAKCQGIAFNDNLLSGPDLLQRLIGISFRFLEHQIARLADIEAMFFKLLYQALTADAYDFRVEDAQSILRVEDRSLQSTHDPFLGRKACRFVQIRLCINSEI